MRITISLSVRIIVLLLGIVLEVSAASEYKILSGCDESAEVRALVLKDSPIEIHFSIAGFPTCYSVTATVDGKQVRGYVLNAGLDAVLAFDKAGTKTRRELLNAPPILAPPLAQIPDPGAHSIDTKKSVDIPVPIKEVPKTQARKDVVPG